MGLGTSSGLEYLHNNFLNSSIPMPNLLTNDSTATEGYLNVRLNEKELIAWFG